MKTIEPNFKELGPKYGKSMKLITFAIKSMSQNEIKKLEQNKKIKVAVGEQSFDLLLSEVKITSN